MKKYLINAICLTMPFIIIGGLWLLVAPIAVKLALVVYGVDITHLI